MKILGSWPSMSWLCSACELSFTVAWLLPVCLWNVDIARIIHLNGLNGYHIHWRDESRYLREKSTCAKSRAGSLCNQFEGRAPAGWAAASPPLPPLISVPLQSSTSQHQNRDGQQQHEIFRSYPFSTIRRYLILKPIVCTLHYVTNSKIWFFLFM